MARHERHAEPLSDLKSGERSLILSFLAMSEKQTLEKSDASEELALSIALKSSLLKAKN